MCTSLGFGPDVAKRAQNKANDAQAAAQAEQERIQAESAAEAQRQQLLLQQQEQQRQDNIRGGISAVDQAFTGFNDEFFRGGSDAYAGYYLPQIEDSRKQTAAKLTANLAEKGMLESTAGINKIAALEKRAGDERTRIGDEAASFAQNIRQNVDQQRNQLYDTARTAADPNAVAAQATGAATTLAQAPGGFTKTSIGNVFSDFLTPLAYATNAASNSRQGLKGFSFAPTSGSGSARYI